MKKVGYHKKTAGAVEAAASTGGQIMPPIMGAGAFIMAEITGIPYQEIAIAAIIPAVLYFVSVYLMVDFEAAKLGMRGMREDELPKFNKMVRQIYLFIPIVILIYALFHLVRDTVSNPEIPTLKHAKKCVFGVCLDRTLRATIV